VALFCCVDLTQFIKVLDELPIEKRKDNKLFDNLFYLCGNNKIFRYGYKLKKIASEHTGFMNL